MASRFVTFNEEELNDLLKGKTSKNTDTSTKTAINLLKTFCRETESNDPTATEISSTELDKILQRFYAGVRKANGEVYKTTTMNSFRFSFQRYFLASGYNIILDPAFEPSNICFKNVLIKIKKAGKGMINHYPEIEPEDVRKLYASFNTDTPAGLQEKVWFDIMFYLCRRGRENLREMTKSTYFVDRVQLGNSMCINVRARWTKTITSKTQTEKGGYMKQIAGIVQFAHLYATYPICIRFNQPCGSDPVNTFKQANQFGTAQHL